MSLLNIYVQCFTVLLVIPEAELQLLTVYSYSVSAISLFYKNKKQLTHLDTFISYALAHYQTS